MKRRIISICIVLFAIAGLSLVFFGDFFKDEHVNKVDARLSLANIPAFPGAEGYGAYTYGGRYNPFTNQNGTVIKVTTLADSGPGSLREAVETPGPRIIVFEVSGIIELEMPIYINEPFCTIAGQTAPSQGISLKNQDLRIRAPNAVVRYIHSRPGDEYNRDPENIDGIQVIGNPPSDTYNVILDHCSLSWSQDETFSTWYESHDITVQWCIISEGLNDANHPKGAHSKGVLIGDGSDNITMHHNLIAHQLDRNPFIKSRAVDYFNNIHYNFERPMHLWPPDHGEKIPIRLNAIGNMWIRGPSNYKYVHPSIQIHKAFPLDEHPQIYIQDNWGPTIANPTGFASDYDILGIYYEDFPDPTELGRIIDSCKPEKIKAMLDPVYKYGN